MTRGTLGLLLLSSIFTLTSWPTLDIYIHSVSSADEQCPHNPQPAEPNEKDFLVCDIEEISKADPYQRIAGFYHLVMLGPWKEIFYQQMLAVSAGGLLNQSDFLFLNVVGERSEWVPLDLQGLQSDKIFLSFHGALDDYEPPTLDYLQRYCNGFPKSTSKAT